MYDYEEEEYTKSFSLSVWKKVFGFAFRYKWTVILLMLFNFGIAAGDQAFPLLTRYAIDTFAGGLIGADGTAIPPADIGGLWRFLPVYFAVVIFQAGVIFGFVRCASAVQTRVVRDVRQKAFKHLQELSFSYFDTTHVGWIMARMTSDAQRIGDVLGWGAFDLLFGASSIVLASTVMFVLNWKLALVVLCTMPLVGIASFNFQKRILRRFRESKKLNSKITAAYNEGIAGARTTKTLVREEQNLCEFKDISMKMRRASLRAYLLTSLHFPVVIGLTSIGVGAVVWAGGVNVLNNLITIGTFSAFISYAMNIMDPIMEMAAILSEMQNAQSSAERTITLLETPSDINDDPAAIEKYGDTLNPKPENWEPITGAVEFRNVSFKYKTGETVLEDFNLTVKPGERIALVGETGAGKSTIVNLICRFYEPTDGQILIDGVDYRARSQIWLQSSLGYVLQTPHLFAGTIRDNIRYGRLDATEDEIAAAAKSAGAWPFIQKLEGGMDYDVGEGGGKLSLGEKQLVSFARAILGRSKLFVLDEATASVDTETESKIQAAIESALKDKTSFIVAHRLSTIRGADRILVIDGGRIIEQGSHRHLLRLRGVYHKLYTNQFKEEAESKLLSTHKS